MKFSSGKQEDLTLNLTPLIDVVFLLLIFFMVTTSFQKENDLAIQLPQTEFGNSSDNNKKAITVSIDKEGNYLVNNLPLTTNSSRALRSQIEPILQSDGENPFHIRADGQTSHQAVVTVMEVVTELGITDVTIKTETP